MLDGMFIADGDAAKASLEITCDLQCPIFSIAHKKIFDPAQGMARFRDSTLSS